MMESILKDRYMRGLVAGSVAGIIALLWNQFAYHILHITTLLWADFASAIIFRRKPEVLWEFLFASVVTVMFTGLLGILFSLVIPIIKSKYLWLKAWIYGMMGWFAIYAISLMFRIPTLTEIPSGTAAAHALSGSIWGICLGVFINLMEKRLERIGNEKIFKSKIHQFIPSPARKHDGEIKSCRPKTTLKIKRD